MTPLLPHSRLRPVDAPPHIERSLRKMKTDMTRSIVPHRAILAVAALAFAAHPAALAQDTGDIPRGEPVYAVTAFGLEPVYPDGFDSWAYVNVEAPEDGVLRASAFGSFDTLNRFTLRGDSPLGLTLVDSSIGVASADESSVIYANLAESFEVAEDRSWVVINLRRDAYFHDGHPITAEDVIFTYDILLSDAHPIYGIQSLSAVESYEAVDDHTVFVRLDDTTDPEAVLGVLSHAILPQHYWEGRDFASLTLEPPLGSGPYRVADLQPGQWIEYERVDDWWGADLPRNRGLYNFERIRYDYYRDNTVRYEALKAGEFDYIGATDPRQWAQGFEGSPAVADGRLIMDPIPYDGPETFAGIYFNVRQPNLADVRVRQALVYLYDFESVNRTVLFNLYRRNVSLFQNSEFAARGEPEGGELALLEQFRGQIPDTVFGEALIPPVTDGSGTDRQTLREALRLLQEAGYESVDGVMTHMDTGEPLQLEIIYADPTIERTLLPYQASLRRAGIELVLRPLEGARWINAYNDRDYEAIIGFLPALYPPGRELRDFYGSVNADVHGSQSITGIQDPVLDELIEAVITSQTWDERIQAARAFDRYLRTLWLMVPLYYDPAARVVYWDVMGRPETRPRFGFSISAMWWFDPSNAAALFENR